MKYTFTVTAAALAAVSSVVLLGLYLTKDPQPVSQTQQNEPALRQRVSPEKNEKTNYEYILAEYEGKLAVFYPNELTPKKVFDIYITTLPAHDQEELAQGIGVTDYEELVVLLEDYIS